jgi:metal-sulfur cluster biosynthetic enzyme
MMITSNEIREKLMPIQDPEIGLGVVDLGLIYDIDVSDDGKVKILMTLTTPACPYGPELVDAVRISVEKMEGVTEAEVEVVWEPQWNPEEMASDYAKDVLGIW